MGAMKVALCFSAARSRIANIRLDVSGSRETGMMDIQRSEEHF
jgi:hypothetical protein